MDYIVCNHAEPDHAGALAVVLALGALLMVSGRSSSQAIRMAESLATTEGHCGAIAFSRTGDPAVGEFEDAVVLTAVGDVDSGLLSD